MTAISTQQGDPIRQVSPEAVGGLREVFRGERLAPPIPVTTPPGGSGTATSTGVPRWWRAAMGLLMCGRQSASRAEGLLVSVRGGGHSAPGYGTNDGGLVIACRR